MSIFYFFRRKFFYNELKLSVTKNLLRMDTVRWIHFRASIIILAEISKILWYFNIKHWFYAVADVFTLFAVSKMKLIFLYSFRITCPLISKRRLSFPIWLAPLATGVCADPLLSLLSSNSFFLLFLAYITIKKTGRRRKRHKLSFYSIWCIL